MRPLPGTVKEPKSGTVDANGNLTVALTAPSNQQYIVRQISFSMPDAIPGAEAGIYFMNSLVDVSLSARRGSAAGEPPLILEGGETCSVQWTGCVLGMVGEVLFMYDRAAY